MILTFYIVILPTLIGVTIWVGTYLEAEIQALKKAIKYEKHSS